MLTVLPGAASVEELREILTYFDTPAAERDYSIISAIVADASGCVYCKHCHPCPSGRDSAGTLYPTQNDVEKDLLYLEYQI